MLKTVIFKKRYKNAYEHINVKKLCEQQTIQQLSIQVDGEKWNKVSDSLMDYKRPF